MVCPQILGPIFNIFINDLEDGTLSKIVNDTKLGEVAGTTEGCAAVHRDLVV